MDTTVVSPNSTINYENLSVSTNDLSASSERVVSDSDTAFDLGVWLSGIAGFLQNRNHLFADPKQTKLSTRDWSKEFRIVHSTLLLCSKLTLQLAKAVDAGKFGEGETPIVMVNGTEFSCTAEELNDLAYVLADVVLVNETILRASPLRYGEWTAWCSVLADKLNKTEAVGKLIFAAEREGERFLPAKLTELLENKPIPFAVEADLKLVLPRFAKMLKWLDAIGRMHDRDQPLKPTMLIFARINEQMQETMRFINNRLLRFKNEEDPLFIALDSAVYAASIELRKVYNFELVGFAETRQTPLIYARVETAHGLLTDCFQQTLINFARLLEPDVKPSELFPSLEIKLRRSLRLREDLWRVLNIVRAAEQKPEEFEPGKLHESLTGFRDNSMRQLFYKDLETVERFIEEVLNTGSRNDLVPILHRFGAYLETLLGQINMRVVLADHPFTPPA